jgi:protein phosphatase PTC7
MSNNKAFSALLGGGVLIAAAAQYLSQQSKASNYGVTISTATPDVAGRTPGTQLETFAQCLGKKELSKGVWKTKSYDQSPQCGEDSFFILDKLRVFGVADGVGGWSRHGVNPKEFSESLMVETKKQIHAKQRMEIISTGKHADLEGAVTSAHAATMKKVAAGSSTVCVASLDKNTHDLHVANLGDSGLVVVRDGHVVFSATESTHGWNFPKQIGVNRGAIHGDSIVDGTHETVKVYSGDMVVTGSDGMLDNITPADIARIVHETVQKPSSSAQHVAQAAARNVLVAACKAALNESEGKWSEGGVGGKPDDITVLVTRVS